MPILERVPGLLTEADGGVLALYCQAYSEWVTADLVIQEKGLTVETKMGEFARPEVKIRDVAAKRMRVFGAELGLTPSSRSRINLSRSTEDDLADGILS